MLLLLASILWTQSHWNALTETLHGHNGRHTFTVHIVCANFKPRGRRITWKKSGEGYLPAIDGRRVWESDGWGPDEIRKKSAKDSLVQNTIEVRRFEVRVDGRRWRVPASPTFDLLNLDLNFEAPNNEHGRAWLSKDGRRLVLKQDGSDGGGGYCAYFVFHANGRVERRIYIESILANRRTG